MLTGRVISDHERVTMPTLSYRILPVIIWCSLTGCDCDRTSSLPAGGLYLEEADLDSAMLTRLESPDQKQNEDFVSSIRVPQVEFSRASLSEALETIQNKAAEHSVSNQSFSVIVEGGAAGSAPDPFGFDKENKVTPFVHSRDHPFSGVYHDVPLTTLLDEVTQHFSCWYEVTPYAVMIRPLSIPRAVSRIAAFPIDQRFFGEDGEEGPLSTVDVLRQHGFLFKGEGHAVHDEANSRLTVKGEPGEIERIGRLLQNLSASGGTESIRN